MVFTFAALTALSLFSQPYAPETDFKLDMSAPYFSQETAKRPKGDNQRIADIIYAKILAHTLYTQMEQKKIYSSCSLKAMAGSIRDFMWKGICLMSQDILSSMLTTRKMELLRPSPSTENSAVSTA